MAKVVKMGKKKIQGKAVELDVLERITLLSILPKEGTFLNLKLVRLVREDLSFTEEENNGLQFRNVVQGDQQMMVWNVLAVTLKKTGAIVKAPSEILSQMLEKDPDLFDVAPSCPPKEFIFGETIEGIIVKSLTELDKAAKITQEHYSLYEKFMEGKETPGK
jgi:hypothetical protein